MAEKKAPNRIRPAALRTIAILVMLAGAVSFVAALIIFGDQVLYLLGSTLITFVGLGLLVSARHSSTQEDGQETGMDTGSSSRQAPFLHPTSSSAVAQLRKAPPGLRAAARDRNRMPPRETGVSQKLQPRQDLPENHAEDLIIDRGNPVQASGHQQESAQNRPFLAGDGLLEQVITILEGQGARVELETRREDRGILRIQSQDGKMFIALVQASPVIVDVADVRALNALVTSSGGARGYFIASGMFTQKAYDWATARQIRLVAEDELDELSI